MRILLIEDDRVMAQGIELILNKENIVVDTATLGEDGIDLSKIYDYDLIVLDLMLPDMDGYQVLKEIRTSKIKTPILILSGLDGIDKKVKGLTSGADDYLTKPYEKEELLARIRAIIRRSQGHADSVIRTGKVELNMDARTVSINGKPLHLTGKEYAIFQLLSLRKGSTLSKEQFLNYLYGGMDEPEAKIIDVFIHKLRAKIKKATGGDSYIKTAFGRGYILQDPK